jgi:hypothetical protein
MKNVIIPFDKTFHTVLYSGQKIHTTRKQLEIEVGDVIDFVDENYKPLNISEECISTQSLELKTVRNLIFMSIDGIPSTITTQHLFRINSGFKNFKELQDFFEQKIARNRTYIGTIIHWTNFKYNQ